MTTLEKIAAFKLLIEKMENAEPKHSGMCRAVAWLVVHGGMKADARDYILDLIELELEKAGIIKEVNTMQESFYVRVPSVYLFPPYEIPPRIAWCEQKIAALKA